ncbi:MAG: DUF4290 domain-containing protein [Prevotellaceae bacterium]|nr:DUF4290 domain-containing protein [Candidatus Colivivens caballi]
MDYNTQREKLILPEYGRCIQNMVNYAKTIEDKAERQRCAFTIIDLMANMQEYSGNEDDFYQKLWNHLAYISNYELDIDYPVEIQHIDEQHIKRDIIPLPQKRIARRHYGAIIEAMAHKLEEMEEGEERFALVQLMANQMKRALANWNINALDDEKIMDDLTELTHGKIQMLPSEITLISDKELLNEIAQQGTKKNKKKK